MKRPTKMRQFWLFIPLMLVLLLVVVLAFSRGRAVATTPEDELIRFNHRKHIAAGISCVFCHPGVLNGPVAGIPSVQKCVGCHQNVQVTSEEGQAYIDILMQHWREKRPLVWTKNFDLPDFVFFNHRPHIAAGKNCEYCHGDVSQMTVARPAYRINMGFCLENCHRHQDPATRERLMSCSTCHR